MKTNIDIGVWIKFKAATRADYKAVWRKVNGDWDGCPTVRYHGWGNFVVRRHEILAVSKTKP